MRLIERLRRLEAQQAHSFNVCDLKRRLARYKAYFEDQPWECTGTPERKAKKDADLIRYKAYFDSLEAGQVPRWEQ